MSLFCDFNWEVGVTCPFLISSSVVQQLQKHSREIQAPSINSPSVQSKEHQLNQAVTSWSEWVSGGSPGEHMH